MFEMIPLFFGGPAVVRGSSASACRKQQVWRMTADKLGGHWPQLAGGRPLAYGGRLLRWSARCATPITAILSVMLTLQPLCMATICLNYCDTMILTHAS